MKIEQVYQDPNSNFQDMVNDLASLTYKERVSLLRKARNQFEGSEWHLMNSSLIGYQCISGKYGEAERSFKLRLKDGTMNNTAIDYYKRAITRHPKKNSLLKLLPRQGV